MRFSDRHDLPLPGGGRTYACDECYQRARAAKGAELTEADTQAIASNGLAVGVNYLTVR